MAKLSAHGYEVARIKYRDKLGTDTDYEITLSFRSDGHIMRNLKALNIHACTSPFHGEAWHDCPAPHHVYGWKLWKRLPRTGDPSQHDIVTRQRDLAAKAIEQAREAGSLIDSTIL